MCVRCTYIKVSNERKKKNFNRQTSMHLKLKCNHNATVWMNISKLKRGIQIEKFMSENQMQRAPTKNAEVHACVCVCVCARQHNVVQMLLLNQIILY